MVQGSDDQVRSPLGSVGKAEHGSRGASNGSFANWEADMARREARIQAMAEEQARREAERRKTRRKGPGLSRAAVAITTLSIAGLVAIVALIVFVIHGQSVERRRQAEAAAAAERALQEQMAEIRAGQVELRRLNQERDALLAQLTEGMSADKEAVRRKLEAIEAKRKVLAAKLAERRRRADHRGRHRGKKGLGKTETKPSHPTNTGPLDRRYDVLPD